MTSVALIVLLMPALASCGGDGGGDGTTAASTPSSTTEGVPPRQSTQPAATPGVGEAFSIRSDFDERVLVNVTLTRVIDPVPPPSVIESPGRKERYVGIELEFDNQGRKSYVLGLPGTLITRDNRRAEVATLLNGRCGLRSADESLIPPGSNLVVCFAFEVPKGAQPKTYEYLDLFGSSAKC